MYRFNRQGEGQARFGPIIAGKPDRFAWFEWSMGIQHVCICLQQMLKALAGVHEVRGYAVIRTPKAPLSGLAMSRRWKLRTRRRQVAKQSNHRHLGFSASFSGRVPQCPMHTARAAGLRNGNPRTDLNIMIIMATNELLIG